MSALAIIPARGGSKGLPGKNLAQIRGRSLVGIAVEHARAVTEIDDVLVSSDDDYILAEARRWGARAVSRPENLARDDTPTIQVVRALVANEPEDRVIVLLQPTSPLRSASDIGACLSHLDEPDVVTVVTVTELAHPPEWNCAITRDGWIRRQGASGTVSRRQDAPRRYLINGAVYATTAGHIMKNGFVGERTKAVVMPRERSIDIDDGFDLQFARVLARLTTAQPHDRGRGTCALARGELGSDGSR